MNGNSVLESLSSRLKLEHANNFRKTGKINSELRVIRDAVITRTKYLTPSAKSVLNVLQDESNRFNPTRAVIAGKAELSLSSVGLALNQLEHYAIIKREAFRRKLGRNQTERAVKYHLNHISAWRLPDGAAIAKIKYPKLKLDAMIAGEHRELGLHNPIDFGVIVNLGRKVGKGRKAKPVKESTEDAELTSNHNLTPNTLKPQTINDNPNPEKINKADLTDLMKKVMRKISVFPGIDLNAPASYRDCLDKLRNEILAGLKTENPRLDLEAMLYAAVDNDLYRRMALTSQPTQFRMRGAAFWIREINAGRHLSFRAQLDKVG